MQSELFQAFIWYNCDDDDGLQLWKPQIPN